MKRKIIMRRKKKKTIRKMKNKNKKKDYEFMKQNYQKVLESDLEDQIKDKC